jgi:hypothetical protein
LTGKGTILVENRGSWFVILSGVFVWVRESTHPVIASLDIPLFSFAGKREILKM